jgi:pyruvate dehydrogenase (quinone)
MGPGVPYAIGAKFAHPGRPAVALVGDGAMQMNGMAELLTVSRYWQSWSDPRLVVAVLHNNDLNQVTWEMRAVTGVRKFEDSQDLPDVSYAAFAASAGLLATEVRHADEIAPAWERALAADRPTVLDVHTDPDVPPIPPHATTDQMRAMAKSLAGGDPDAWGVLKTGVRQKAQELMTAVKGR